MTNSIRGRIILACALPLLGLLILSASVVVSNWTVARQMDSLARLAVLAPKVSALIHELQKERGNSAGFLGAHGQGDFVDRLARQRSATDAKLADYRGALANFPAADYGPTMAERLAAADKALAALDATRGEVSALKTEVGKAAAYYTGTIAVLLSTVAEMSVLSQDAEVSSAIAAYKSFLEAKERMGLERALGSNGFSAGKFAPAVYRTFVELGGQQAAFLTEFAAQAHPNQIAQYRDTVKGPQVDAVAQMREVAVNSVFSGNLNGIAGPQWFDAITAKINLMKQVEDGLAADLETLVADHRAQARQTTVITAAVVLALLAAATWTTALTVRGIVRPMGRIITAIEGLAAGRLDVEVEQGHQIGEVADLSRAIAVLKANSIERLELAEHEKAEQQAHVDRAIRIETLIGEYEATSGEVIRAVAAAATELQASARSMTAIADEAANEAAAVANSARQASANVQSVAEAGEAMSAAISEIVTRVEESSAMTAKAAEAADAIDSKVATLEKAATEVGKVVGLINDIAGQTARSTSEISAQVAEIQGSSNDTARAIRTVGAMIAEINGVSAAIAAAMEEQSATTAQVVSNVEAAARCTADVSTTIAGVDRTSREADRAAADLLSAAGELSRQTEVLRGRTETFLANIRAA